MHCNENNVQRAKLIYHMNLLFTRNGTCLQYKQCTLIKHNFIYNAINDAFNMKLFSEHLYIKEFTQVCTYKQIAMQKNCSTILHLCTYLYSVINIISFYTFFLNNFFSSYKCMNHMEIIQNMSCMRR